MAADPLPRYALQAAYYRIAKLEAVAGLLCERVQMLERRLGLPDDDIRRRGRPSYFNLLLPRDGETPQQVATRLKERLKKRRQRARRKERAGDG